jgi:type IV pilus assembly protein PilM
MRTVPHPLPLMAKSPSSRRTVVGLDIEPGYVAAVEVKAGDHLVVERTATCPLEPGVIRDGEVVDSAALADALRELWKTSKLPKKVRLGVANQRIVVRTIDLPPLKDSAELAAAIRFQAQDHIPMPLEDAVLEYQSLGIVDTPDGPRARVVLVAARRDMVNRFLDAARSAGLRPTGIDLSAFAMIRALDDGHAGNGATLYLAVGGMTNLALADGWRCLFTRVVPGGFQHMVQELAERRGLTLDHAEGWLDHVGLVAEPSTIEGDPEIVSEARSVLADGARRIADEVRNSLDFYRMQDSAIVVERAVLTGPIVSVPGFAAALSVEIGLPVTARVVEGATADAVPAMSAGRYVVAAGLAVEEMTSA